MDTAATNEKIKLLRESKSKDMGFGKAFTGGYRKREVEEYISTLRSNMEQSQRAFYERLDESASECGMLLKQKNALQQEKEALLAECQKLANDLERSNAQFEKTGRAMATLRTENERLTALILDLQTERDALLENSNREEMEALRKGNEDLAQTEQRMTAELDAIKAAHNEAKRFIESLKEANRRQEEDINALIASKRSMAMDANMKLYHYRLNIESNLKHAKQNLQDLFEMMDLLKNESDAMFEKTKIDLN